MNLSGETEIAASRQRVWDTISNPNRAAASSSSGQAQIEKIDDRHYKVTVAAPGMPMGVTLDMQVTELDAPSRIAATIEGAVMGGPINGTGSIDLAELGPKLTRATWVADATLGGLLGGFEPMLQGPLQQGADQGFVSLKTRLEAEEAAAGA
jgi:Uncharacterized conserved protein